MSSTNNTRFCDLLGLLISKSARMICNDWRFHMWCRGADRATCSPEQASKPTRHLCSNFFGLDRRREGRSKIPRKCLICLRSNPNVASVQKRTLVSKSFQLRFDEPDAVSIHQRQRPSGYKDAREDVQGAHIIQSTFEVRQNCDKNRGSLSNK